MVKDEEKLLEAQLELQLEEQKESLSAVKDALASDPDNLELLAIHEELVSVIRDAEEGLLHLKRARLLQEADSVLQASTKVVVVESLDPTEDVVETLEDQSYPVGSKCRFMHTDGRWYNGEVIELDGSSSAKVSFLTPTSESMLICKFYLQQRCRFGANCRLSHGIIVPLDSLKRYVPTIWQPSLIGSSVWAHTKSGLWKAAVLKSWNESLNEGRIVFHHDGSSENLGVGSIVLSENAHLISEEDNTSTSELSDSSDSEPSSPRGLGFVESTALQKGVQKETAVFAKWENHTRGIASKMMANMGYREGMGLGVSGQGMVDPISVKVLPKKQSLDHALQSSKDIEAEESTRRKRSRGGKRKRDKKFAEAACSAKQMEESRPDVFSLINKQLAMHSGNINGGSGRKPEKEDRRAMVAYEDKVTELRARAEKLEEMAHRNKKEKVVYEAAVRKLIETRRDLADAEATHASTSKAVASKENEKRWLKF